MTFEVRIPTLGESVTEGVIVRWAKQDGEAVKPDDVLLELETDKASMELPAERAGVLRIVKPAGEKVVVGELVARIEEDGGARAAAPAAPRPPAAVPEPAVKPPPAAPEAAPKPAPAAPTPHLAPAEAEAAPAPAPAVGPLSPAVRRLLAEHARAGGSPRRTCWRTSSAAPGPSASKCRRRRRRPPLSPRARSGCR